MEDDQWFNDHPVNLQNLIVDRCANEVQKSVEEAVEFNKPVFKKYNRPDDTQWAGWYEIDGKPIGYKGLNKSFCPIIEEPK